MIRYQTNCLMLLLSLLPSIPLQILVLQKTMTHFGTARCFAQVLHVVFCVFDVLTTLYEKFKLLCYLLGVIPISLLLL